MIEAMFFSESNYEEAKTSVVEITDIDADVFNKFLLWIYSNETNFECVQEAVKVFQAANKYEVIDLERICEKYVLENINSETVCTAWKFGDIYDKTAIKDKAIKVIQNNTIEVLHSENFLKAEIDTLMVILLQDKLWIGNEMALFEALEKYGKANSLGRCELDAAVRCIRFLAINVEQFRNVESTLLSDKERQGIINNLASSETTTIQYPEGFSESTIPRCNNYVHISESDRELLELVREAQYKEEEIWDYMDYDERYINGTPADLLFHDLTWHTNWRIAKVLKNHLPRENGESNNKYLVRIFKDNNLIIIAALVEAFNYMNLEMYLKDD